MSRVGIVIASHSDLLARGVAELAGQMAPGVVIGAAGGLEDGGLGTSYDRIEAALEAVLTAVDGPGSGAVVLTDLGSATMTAESVVEMSEAPERIRLVDTALVEGAVAAAVRAEVGDALVVCADTCLDEFTDHGHCGLLDSEGGVDNDATLPLYQAMAISQARAGAHMVSPSGMMDGQVAAIRAALDQAGHADVAILAYSAKYASAYFGPFREAVGSTLKGDRRTYQQDPANRREGLFEALLDAAEGADMLMVKPAGPYLDVLADVAAASDIPVAAYQVSGEYAMVEAAAANGWIDRTRVIDESLTGIFRAGADSVLTYWALEVARRAR